VAEPGGLAARPGSSCARRPVLCTEILKERETDPDVADWACCFSDCDVQFAETAITGWRALKSYFRRSDWTLVKWGGQPWDPGFEWAGHCWEEAEISDESWRLAMEDGYWPGIWPLAGIAPLPLARPDGSVIPVTGYDRSTGFWLTLAGAPGQRAVPQTPAQKLLALAEAGRWTGTTTRLAEAIGWTGTPRALSAVLKKAAPALDALNVAIEYGGRDGETRAQCLTVCLRNDPPTLSILPPAET
jgi:hypothetical protein